jgi:hypothetical protein
MIKITILTLITLLFTACGSDSDSMETTQEMPIVIIGPSTVYINKEQRSSLHYSDDSECPLYGWGELLPEFTIDDKQVFNYAQPGASAGSFTIPPEQRREDEQVLFGPNRDHYWAATKEKMQALKKGFLFIQFGGNDARHLYLEEYPYHEDNNQSKPIVDYNHDGVGDDRDSVAREALVEVAFKKNMKFYIDEARALHFTPVLITSPSSRTKDADTNKLKYSREPFVTYTKELAQSENISLLDLNAKSIEVFEPMHEAELNREFADCYNRWSKTRENTHYEKHGARKVASWIRDLACTDTGSEVCQVFIKK